MELRKDESIEELGDGQKLIVSPDHGFGTDAFLLADFADPWRSAPVCDLGTGCGIIPMLLKRNGVTAEIYGVDIQERAIDQFRRSLELCGFPAQFHPVLADLRHLPEELPRGQFRTVVMNPPYQPVGSGDLSRSDADQIARHETMCTMEDVVAAAKALLNFGGKLILCGRPERLVDVMTAMRAGTIEPKRLRFVQKRPDTAPWLFLLEGTLGGKPYLRVEAPLIIQNADGGNSDELNRILGSYTHETEDTP